MYWPGSAWQLRRRSRSSRSSGCAPRWLRTLRWAPSSRLCRSPGRTACEGCSRGFGAALNAATAPDSDVSAALRRACSSDPVDPSASLTLLGHHIEPELLLQGSSDGAAHRVSLPAEGG